MASELIVTADLDALDDTCKTTMTIKHLTIMCEVEVFPGAEIKFVCEVEHDGAGYRARGSREQFGMVFPTVDQAIAEEAGRHYSLHIADFPGKLPILQCDTTGTYYGGATH